ALGRQRRAAAAAAVRPAVDHAARVGLAVDDDVHRPAAVAPADDDAAVVPARPEPVARLVAAGPREVRRADRLAVLPGDSARAADVLPDGGRLHTHDREPEARVVPAGVPRATEHGRGGLRAADRVYELGVQVGCPGGDRAEALTGAVAHHVAHAGV